METESTTKPLRSSTHEKTVESKLEEPTTSTTGSPEELVQIIKEEHACVKALYEEYLASKDDEVKSKKACEICEQIVAHAGREEQALYPAMREIPALGDAEVEKAKAEHQLVTEDLAKLHKLKYSESKSEFDALLGKVMKDLNDHLSDEESRILPLFVQHCPKEKANSIMQAYKSAIVTTLPHPSAPREGMAAKMAHAASIPIDEAQKGIEKVMGTK